MTLDIERLKKLRKAAWPMKLEVSKHGDATCVTDGHTCLVHDLSPVWAAFITETANQMDAIIARLEQANAMEEALKPFAELGHMSSLRQADIDRAQATLNGEDNAR